MFPQRFENSVLVIFQKKTVECGYNERQGTASFPLS